ncbi:hypothetical protein MCEMIH16_00491 [Caulobacteraceae bacterium]
MQGLSAAIAALTMIVFLSSPTATPAHATTIERCERADRNTTFLVPAAKVQAFRTFVRAYSDQNGLRLFADETADNAVLSQIIHTSNWSWGIVVLTIGGAADASASFEGGTACNKDLPIAHKKAWKQFIAAAGANGYQTTHAKPGFLKFPRETDKGSSER